MKKASSSGFPGKRPGKNVQRRRTVRPESTKLNQATTEQFEREEMGIAPKE